MSGHTFIEKETNTGVGGGREPKWWCACGSGKEGGTLCGAEIK